MHAVVVVVGGGGPVVVGGGGGGGAVVVGGGGGAAVVAVVGGTVAGVVEGALPEPADPPPDDVEPWPDAVDAAEVVDEDACAPVPCVDAVVPAGPAPAPGIDVDPVVPGPAVAPVVPLAWPGAARPAPCAEPPQAAAVSDTATRMPIMLAERLPTAASSGSSRGGTTPTTAPVFR